MCCCWLGLDAHLFELGPYHCDPHLLMIKLRFSKNMLPSAKARRPPLGARSLPLSSTLINDKPRLFRVFVVVGQG